MPFFEPLGSLLSAVTTLLKVVGTGTLTLNSFFTIGLGAVILIFAIKYWYVVQLIAFIWIFRKVHNETMKQYKNVWGFFNKWVFPMVLPLVGDIASLGIGVAKKRETTIHYDVVHRDTRKKSEPT
jgi:hypothetical protein